MSLVGDLLAEVVDFSGDLGQVLRKARVLASELRSEELEAWSEAELSGYKEDEVLPSYRVFRSSGFGNFVGSFGKRASNLPIPLSNLPEQWRESVSKLELRSGVAALQEMLRAEGDYKQVWSGDAVAAVSGDIYSDMNMTSAWKVIPKASVAGALDAVRNGLLSFLLDLKKKHPEVDTADTILQSIPKDDISVSVVNIIYGGHNVVESGGTIYQEVRQDVKPGDLKSLLDFLRKASLSEELVSELPAAIEEDEPDRKGGIGPRVSGWLARVGETVLTNVPVAIATQALLQYYGQTGA